MNEYISKDIDIFSKRIEERLSHVLRDRRPFALFLEEKMDCFDYSNTSLAKQVFHRVYRKKENRYVYVPVTRQAIGTWLRGSMPSSREIYVTLGIAFHMNLTEINHVLLESYMGYGLYCKNIEDALWIALINGLFPIEEMDGVKARVEEILAEEDPQGDSRSLPTMDLWEILAQADSLESFYGIISQYRNEFRNGAKQFGIALNEVIEEEYGYYEKASWFLRDIGCLHCEAQFSKIRAGKAVVTRDWLIRFLIALHPSIDSIRKLLAKAQMEPLGITPVEMIIEMISTEEADMLSNSQEMWILIESVAENLVAKGYEIEDDLCRKYDSVYDMTPDQKLVFSICLGEGLIERQKNKDFGYIKSGYCRHHAVDAILFDEANKCRKSNAFKESAQRLCDLSKTEIAQYKLQALEVKKNTEPDPLDLEKFEDYCLNLRPSRFSADFVGNDTYFFAALLYSVWTGKCFVKTDVASGDTFTDLDAEMEKAGYLSPELSGELKKALDPPDKSDRTGIRTILNLFYGMAAGESKEGKK